MTALVKHDQSNSSLNYLENVALLVIRSVRGTSALNYHNYVSRDC